MSKSFRKFRFVFNNVSKPILHSKINIKIREILRNLFLNTPFILSNFNSLSMYAPISIQVINPLSKVQLRLSSHFSRHSNHINNLFTKNTYKTKKK